MNAIASAKKMAQELTAAGFNVEISETEKSFDFSAMSNNQLFDTTYIFIGHASVTSSNRTRKYFSATRSMVFSKTQSKRNISYAQMWREIDWAIKMSNREFAKVGA
jgi:hypothetical protein